jgi:hypothetical protein
MAGTDIRDLDRDLDARADARRRRDGEPEGVAWS